MEYIFSPEEILEMAMQIEINGATFYRTAAEKVSSQEIHAFLIFLAEMEDSHQKTFAAMQEELKKTDPDALMVDPDGEARLYLKAMAETKIFFQKQMPGDHIEEILTSAISAEQESILFYLGMKEMVYDAADKQRIDDIIKEEMRHITLLSRKLTQTSH
ncbi:MAG: ferritin family protein [Desulfobacteraceae bacterium]